MKPLVTFVSLSLLIGCGSGGGSSDADSAISGVWSGPLFLGGQNCTDGSFIGAGSGTVIGDKEIVVRGSDVVGSVVEVDDGDCQLEGTRDEDGFTAYPLNGCGVALDRVIFKLREANSASLDYVFDLSKAPEPGCYGQNNALLERKNT